MGTATKPNFGRYHFDVRTRDGSPWGNVADFYSPVTNGVLMDFSTSSIPSGDYIFRMFVIDNTGNTFPEVAQIEFIIR